MNGIYGVGETVLGNWTLVRLIGEGSFGRVFEAERVDFAAIYKSAVKIISVPQSQSEIKNARAEGMSDESIIAYFRSVVEEVVREIALMSQLDGTANTVGYKDHTVVEHKGAIGWDIVIRMELLTPLLDHIAENPLTRHDVIRLAMDLCRALELCQRFNIVHRDIKPENIFVSDLGDYKLGDFGIARTVEKTASGLSKKGTYSYMAPEIYRGEVYGSSVDIYSLGIVLYRLLNDNRAPFLPEYPAPISHSEREAALAKRISGSAMGAPKNANGRLAEIVLKACAYDPKDRYSCPMQMRQELDAIFYSRDEAPVIYPQGDEAPLRSVEYVDEALPRFEKSVPETTETISENPGVSDATMSLFQETDRRGGISDMNGSGVLPVNNAPAPPGPEVSESTSGGQSFGEGLDAGVPDVDYDYVTPYIGNYVFWGTYMGSPIKWIVYDIEESHCCLLCADSLYSRDYNVGKEDVEIREDLIRRVLPYSFTPEQQKAFIPIDGDVLALPMVEDIDFMSVVLKQRQLRSSSDNWLKDRHRYLSKSGRVEVMDYHQSELNFGVRPICEIDMKALDIVDGSGSGRDPCEICLRGHYRRG